jgi:formylglycine-generating enzyme required for sulfatase activity
MFSAAGGMKSQGRARRTAPGQRVVRLACFVALAAAPLGQNFAISRAFADAPSPHEPELGPEIEPRLPEDPIARRKVPLENGMLRIPGGDFAMGHEGAAPGEPNERPVHWVSLPAFWIDRTEVTVEQMRNCMGIGACTQPLGRGPSCTAERGASRAPINCVSWQAADGFCRAVGKRLPTEAEWEFAAGGGQKARYPWGSSPPTCAAAVTLVSNRSGVSCSLRGPALVGSHPRGASVFGAEDMAGNVEEWVSDWYADRYEVRSLRDAPAASPSGPAFGVAHVLRGGSWMSRPRETRVTARNWGSANEAGANVGFRCARDDAGAAAGHLP